MRSRKVKETIDTFSDYILQGRTVFFVGAGVSNAHPSHLPLAGQVSESIIRNIYQQSEFLPTLRLARSRRLITEEEFVTMLLYSQGHEIRFESLMQLILDTVGDLKILSLFERHLPNHNHRFLADLLASGNRVVTVNFDTLIETAFSRNGKLEVSTLDASSGDVTEPLKKRNILFKIHGTLDRAQTIRATVRQVGRSGLAFMWEPTKGQFIEELVQADFLVFIGYSGADDLDIMSKLAITEFTNEVLWIKHASSEPTWVGPRMYAREFDDEMLLKFLRNHNVSVVKAETDSVIRELWVRTLDSSCIVPTRNVICRCRHKNSYLSIIHNTINHWKYNNPGLIDFLASRLLYETGFQRESLYILKFLEVFYRKTQDNLNYSKTLVNMGVIEENLGLYTAALEHNKSACVLLSAQGNIPTWCSATINVAVLAMRQGDLTQAATNLKDVIKVSEDVGLKQEYARACSNLAAILRMTGHYEDALAKLTQAYNTYKSLGDHTGCAVVFSTAGEIAFVQEGNAKKAEAYFNTAMEEAKRLRDNQMVAKLKLNLGAVYIRIGNYRAARGSYREVALIAESTNHRQYLTLSEIGLCKVALSSGRLTKAITEGKKLFRKAKRIGLHVQIAELRGNIGIALKDKKRYSEALKYFQIVKRDFQSTMKSPELLALTFENIARCHLALGNKVKSVDSFQRALSIYEEIDMPRHCDQIRDSISRI